MANSQQSLCTKSGSTVKTWVPSLFLSSRGNGRVVVWSLDVLSFREVCAQHSHWPLNPVNPFENIFCSELAVVCWAPRTRRYLNQSMFYHLFIVLFDFGADHNGSQ